ncbi:MAG: heme o synthase [Roseimicrobium sp.]
MTETETTTAAPPQGAMKDLMALTKLRLSLLVIVTTFVGFWLNSKGSINWWLLIHTLVGSTLAAFGASVFNQLMEIDVDKRMKRTADRPLPSSRMQPGAAFAIGWLLSAFAIIHLVKMVNVEAATLCAMTLAVYLFIYTPMKQQSAWNTIVGAVSGALPPLIGWAGAAGLPAEGDSYFRWQLIVSPGAIYLFLLLFLWQLPHFLAINWMYRDEYRKGGFIMWANDDDTGVKTSRLAFLFSICTVAAAFLPALTGQTTVWFLPATLLINGALLWLAWKFLKTRDRPTARKLFFYTLMHLPLLLGVSMAFWKRP